jgi:hypothetical protein
MLKAWTAFVMIMMLLWGSIGIAAFADTGSSFHAVDIVDAGCHDKAEDSSNSEPDVPDAPISHVDHHHCSAALPTKGPGIASTNRLATVPRHWLIQNQMISRATAPPTQPPSV